jgi:1-acyl-sn-glycerol-3-phosphate acyltransferase
MEANQLERELVRFRPPGKAVISTLASPYRRVLAPVFLGWENIPADAHLKPILFVSNHTVMAFDFPLFLDEIYRKRGLFPRVLADHSHFQIPVNSEILRTFFGAVDGTRKNVDVLMAAKKCLFVYPGGAREVFKRTTDTPYDLMWDGKQGFAIMAIKHGCTIVPVINYGTEDMLTVIADLPLGWLPVPFLWGSNRTLPIMKPAEKNAVRRIYFLFGQPISTEAVKGQEANQEVVDTVKQQTQQAIEDGLGFLKEYARMERLERKQKRLLKKAQLPASASKKRQDDNTDALRALAEEIKASSKRLQSTTKLPATL